MSRRTWRTTRTPKYEHPTIAARGRRLTGASSRVADHWSIPLTSHRPCGQPKGDPPLDEQEEDDDRDRRQRRARHQRAPVLVAAAAEEERQPDGDRLLRLVV